MASRYCVVLLCAAILLDDVSAVRRYHRSPDNHKRITRAIGSVASFLGTRALNRIMSGTRTISRADANPREYVKKGGASTALEDLYAVLPDNIHYFQEPNKVFAQSGVIGDRTIIVRSGENIKPTLTIFKTDEASDPNALRHVITYTRNEKLLHAPRVDTDLDDWW